VGNYIEVNDTLQINIEQGFPADVLDLKKHQSNPVKLEDVADCLFAFSKKPRARVFHLEPVRVFLVQNIGGKWLFWGHAQIQEQTISKTVDENGEWNGDWETAGKYKVSKIYPPDLQKCLTSAPMAQIWV